MIIAVDFDGTCVTHEFPRMGKEIGAKIVLKKLTDAGHKLILWTMRCYNPSYQFELNNTLKPAVKWFEDNDIPLWGINENPQQKRGGWSTSNKAYANLYIDDAALGVPLKTDLSLSSRPFIDWEKVDEIFDSMGLYKAVS
jgi:hypothetical protein